MIKLITVLNHTHNCIQINKNSFTTNKLQINFYKSNIDETR